MKRQSVFYHILAFFLVSAFVAIFFEPIVLSKAYCVAWGFDDCG